MRRIQVLVAIALLSTVFSSSEPQSCTDAKPSHRGSLIQMKSQRGVESELLDWTRIPAEVKQVGVSLFGSETNVINLLQQSQVRTISYSGMSMQIVMAKNDDAINRYGPGLENGDDYGLDEVLAATDARLMDFEARRVQNDNMINMIDVGGNLGIVTIAMYMKYPGLLRAVVLEPLPVSHFYLHLNLHANGVPPLIVENFGKPQPGVGAVQQAAAATSNEKVELCTMFHDQWSSYMNSFTVRADRPCDCEKDICSSATTISVDDVMNNFGDGDITLLKMDCEECERDILPALDAKYSHRIRQLSGEMHMMGPEVVDLACKYNDGRFLTGMCEKSVEKFGTEHLSGKEFCEVCSSREMKQVGVHGQFEPPAAAAEQVGMHGQVEPPAAAVEQVGMHGQFEPPAVAPEQVSMHGQVEQPAAAAEQVGMHGQFEPPVASPEPVGMHGQFEPLAVASEPSVVESDSDAPTESTKFADLSSSDDPAAGLGLEISGNFVDMPVTDMPPVADMPQASVELQSPIVVDLPPPEVPAAMHLPLADMPPKSFADLPPHEDRATAPGTEVIKSFADLTPENLAAPPTIEDQVAVPGPGANEESGGLQPESFAAQPHNVHEHQAVELSIAAQPPAVHGHQAVEPSPGIIEHFAN